MRETISHCPKLINIVKEVSITDGKRLFVTVIGYSVLVVVTGWSLMTNEPFTGINIIILKHLIETALWKKSAVYSIEIWRNNLALDGSHT